MSGYIGKMVNLISRGTRRVKRITALDPAKPLFYTNLTGMISYIHKDDADVCTIAIFNNKMVIFPKNFNRQLVDIIHTNAGILGSSVSVGNCDFWPNGGTLQPGCSNKIDIKCDHRRSWMYYAESVMSTEPIFNAIACDNFDDFKNLSCLDGVTNYMGYHTTQNCSGTFFLQTNNESPFSRDIFGLNYSPFVDIDRQNRQ